MGQVATVLVACCLSAGLTAPVVKWLRQQRMLDFPSDRSNHDSPVVRGGGVAMAAGCVAATVLTGNPLQLRASVAIPLLFALLLGTVGFLDDRKGLKASHRLWAQFGLTAAFILASGNDNSDHPPALQLLVFIIKLVFVAGFINAFNFMDGINGLSSLTAIVTGAVWLVVGHVAASPGIGLLGASLSGAFLGFLPWNFPSAKCFLGDAGSYFAGGLIGGTTVLHLDKLGSSGSASTQLKMMLLAPLILYGADTSFTLAVRFIRSQPLSAPHSEHVYQRLVRGGLSHSTVAVLVTLASATICASAYLSVVGTLTLMPTLLITASVCCLYLASPLALRGVGLAS